MEAIAHAVIECLKDHNIDISKARGQSYVGEQCMSSDKVGVQARESCYTHSYVCTLQQPCPQFEHRQCL